MSAPQPLSAVLKRIRDMPLQPKPRPGERCELCAELIPDEHGHVVDLESRALMCACRPCYLVFAPMGAGGTRFRAVPDRFVSFPDFTLSTAQWDALQIPVGVAFFFLNSSLDHVAAFYPSPGGRNRVVAVARLVGGDRRTPTRIWRRLQPDVEAFLVRSAERRSGEATAECYLVPIDVCYELVGELRRLWKGFDGGTEAHAALDAFFDRVARQGTAGTHLCRRRALMSPVSFDVVGARVEAYAAVPTLMLRLQITAADAAPVHAIMLRSQIMIEPKRRHYDSDEELRLTELFGETPRWGDTLRPFLWTNVATTVPGFTGGIEVDLPITCTYDFEIAAAKYMHSLNDGEIPIVAMFSGTVFGRSTVGLSAAPVSWSEEASYRLPGVAVARHDGPVLPEHGLAAVATGNARRTAAVQGRAVPC